MVIKYPYLSAIVTEKQNTIQVFHQTSSVTYSMNLCAIKYKDLCRQARERCYQCIRGI